SPPAMYVAQILYTWLLLESFTPTALTQRYRQRKNRRSGELAENENIRDGSAFSERANSMQRPSELENLPLRNVGKGNQRWRHAGPIGGHADVFTNGPYNNRMNVRPFDEVRKGSFGSKQYMPRTRSYYHGNAAPYAGGFPIPYMPKERSSYSWNNRWSSMSSMQMYMPSTEERNYEEPQARPYSEVFPNPYTPEELPPHYWNYERPFKHPRMPFEGEDYIGNHVGPSDDVSKEDLISEESRNSGEDPATEEDRDPEDVASEEGRDMRKYARPNAEGFLNPHKSGVPPYYNWNNRRSLKVMQPYLSPVDKEEMRNYEETSDVSENDQVPKVDEDMRKHARPYMKGVRNTNMPGELPPSYEVFLKSTQQDMQPEEKDNTRIDEESSENFSKKHRFPEEDEEMQRHTRSYEEEVPNSSILGEIPSQSYGEPSDSIQQDMPFTEEITASPDGPASTMLSHSTAQTTPSEDVQPTITSTEVKNSQIETLSERTTSTTLFRSVTQTSYEDIRPTTPIAKGEDIQNETASPEGITPTVLPRLTAQTAISDGMRPETPIAEVKTNRKETIFPESATTTSYNLSAKALSSNNTAAPSEGSTGISAKNMTTTMLSRSTAQTPIEVDRLRTPITEGKGVQSESVTEEVITSTVFPGWTAQTSNESSRTTTTITEGNGIQNRTGPAEGMPPPMLLRSPAQTPDEDVESSPPIIGRNDIQNRTDPAEGMPPPMLLRSPAQTADEDVESSPPITGRNDIQNRTDPAEGMPPPMLLRSPAQTADEDVESSPPITGRNEHSEQNRSRRRHASTDALAFASSNTRRRC
ncbi:hypothetical protein V3C99_009267, partial [Haemonchus contortus]